MNLRRLGLAVVALACAAVFAAGVESSSRAEETLRESVLRLAAGDVAGAEAEARLAAAADPASVRALQQLARAANAALDFSTAEDAAGRALALGAATPALLCLRSEARSGRGDYDGALADAQSAARLNPASGTAVLRLAVAKEGLRRSPEETLADYRRAAELDASLAPLRDAAFARLAPPSSRPRTGLGGLIGLLAVSGLVGWTWARLRRVSESPVPRAALPRAALSGSGRLQPREAARALAAAAKTALDSEAALALAESLYERLTGRPPYPAEGAEIDRSLARFAPPSQIVEGLPVGIDAFFARALDPDAARRFRSGAELSGAFRSLVDPAVE
jgi:tetratricopeptide (TPR) repeat protein